MFVDKVSDAHTELSGNLLLSYDNTDLDAHSYWLSLINLVSFACALL